jgi:uncharacterized protein YjbJ (UPF0337 family)
MEGNWKQLKGEIKSQWGKLTDDELDRIDGKADKLIGAIQKSYGRSKDEVRDEVNRWLKAARQ